MDIKQMLRKALTEGKHKKTTHKNEYGCVMVFLDFKQDQWDGLLSQIKDSDLYNPPDDKTYGKEKEPHVTALFGLHNDIPDEEIEKVIDEFIESKIDIKVGGISSFKNKLFEVIKFDIDSNKMHLFNKKLTKLPHTTNYPDYHPHLTICYVNPSLSDDYINKLNEYIKNNEIIFTPSDIRYSKSDGEVKKYSFK